MFAGLDAPQRLAGAQPHLRIRERRWLSLWAYPLSGFRRWQLIPASFVEPLLRLEDALLPRIGFLAAFRLFVVLERVRAPGAE